MTHSLYIGGRKSGKTTMLVLWYRANPGAKIIVRNQRERQQYFRDYGIPLNDLITLSDVYRGEVRAPRNTPFALDGLEDVFLDALLNLGQHLPGPLEASTFDGDRLDSPHFDTLHLDPAAMEHVASELDETIRHERQRKNAEEQEVSPPQFIGDVGTFFSELDPTVQPRPNGSAG